MWIYVLERIKDSPQWPAGTVIHAHERCKGWRVIKKYWDGHRGDGLRCPDRNTTKSTTTT